MTKAAWTDERIESLKRDWAAGYSASQIARRLGGFEGCADGGRNAVIGKVRRLGLPYRASNGNHSAHGRLRTGEYSGRYRNMARETCRLDGRVHGDKRPTNVRPKPLSPAAQVIKAIRKDGLPIPPPQETDVARVSFAELNEDGKKHCRWPCYSDVPPPDQPAFCGLKPEFGLPYCKLHVARAYGPPNPARPGQQFQLRSLEVA